jgi:hypothetical protein
MSKNQERKQATEWWLKLSLATQTKIVTEHNYSMHRLDRDEIVKLWKSERFNYQLCEILDDYNAKQHIIDKIISK